MRVRWGTVMIGRKAHARRGRPTGWTVLVVTGVVASLAALGLAPAARADDRPATPATFAAVFDAAQPGDTVLLASGEYGTFPGKLEPGMVTIKAQPGATASMTVNFSPAAN